MSEESKKPVVMIVDDSSTNRFLLQEQLKNEYDIITAKDGQEAIDKVISFKQPDIILLDIVMPDIDGYQVCSTLKQNPKTSAIPIIFITSLDETENETHGLQIGAADYITRPFNISIVKSRINVHLDLKQNREQLERIVQKLQEKEIYLRTIMATIQNGVIISDPETQCIIDVNPFLCDMMGYEREELIGKDYRNFLGSGEPKDSDASIHSYVDHSLLKTITTEIIHTRRWFKTARLADKDILVQSLSDITNIKELLKQQDINIYKAKRMMKVIHNRPERNISLDNNNMNLFVNYFFCPSHKEGGDHFFVKTLTDHSTNKDKTFISVKDQSGHNVECILRSITTDLLHSSVLHNYTSNSLSQIITLLNDNISKSNVFSLEEFFTSINFMIDHERLKLHFVSTGHPPFFRIREKTVSILGKPGDPGSNLPIPMPDFQYEEGELDVLPEDKYILFTDGMMDVPLKAGLPPLTIEDFRKQLEKIIHTDSELCISDIMAQFMSWVSEKSNQCFIPKKETDDMEASSINKTGDDITCLWIEVEPSENVTEQKINPKNIEDVDRCIQVFFQDISKKCQLFAYQIPPTKIRTALAEMILNAWKHGNKKDPKRTITIRLRCGNDLHLEVIDEGCGFDFYNLSDPTEPQNILKTSGRGIFMTRYAANEVFWKGNGNHIVAVFKRDYDPLNQEVTYNNDIHLWNIP
ncbi:MAG: response regulator [Candidatus Magnetomorum sp.]|nr:response regulator [Candidatus Magnetomorum sp.]